MKPCIALICLALLAGANLVDAAEPPKTAGHETKMIEGWTLLISDELLEYDKAATARAFELLTVQLQEIVRVVPAAAVVELRKVPLWFSPEYPKVQPRAEYHPGAGWLRENKRDPAMEKGIEFTNVRIFERETKRMPNFALHELAHAYHDRVLAKGFGNVDVKAAFEKTKEKGLYERVEQRFGDGRAANVRAYAMTNLMEYFAECSEAFFSTNDFFPFTREQLAKHDPDMFALLKTLWGEPLSASPEDVSAGAYAAVYARRLIATWDKDASGSIEKPELERQWRSLGRWDSNHDDALSLAELTNSTIPYLQSKGQQKLNVLYKKTAEEDLYLDLYYPEKRAASKLPVVVYTHGGGWTTGSKQNISFGVFPQVYLKSLDQGFAVAAVNYRLWRVGGSVAMRDCVIDAKDAVRYLAKNSDTLGLDLTRCFVHGDSAGGHIAQMLLLSPASSLPGDPALADVKYRMVAGVSWYGPCDFEQPELFHVDDRAETRDRFGPRIIKPGTDPNERLKLYREVSPVQYLRNDSPPLLMIQGDKDTTIPVKHALHMKQKADESHSRVEVMLIKNAGHNWREAGAAIEPGIDEIVQRTIKFLTEHLKTVR